MFRKTFKKGFSLVELLVVITIIAILSVVAYTAVGGQTIKAKNSKRLQDIGAIQTALEFYFVKNGKYPVALSDMGKDIISEIPKDPASTVALPLPYYYKRGDSAGGDLSGEFTYVLATTIVATEQGEVTKSRAVTNDSNFSLTDWLAIAPPHGACPAITQLTADAHLGCVPYNP